MLSTELSCQLLILLLWDAATFTTSLPMHPSCIIVIPYN